MIVWGPLSLALITSNVLTALSVRGSSLAIILVVRVLVTAFGISAGIALATRRGPAVAMAKASLLLSAATDVFIYTTPYFPNNRMPGDTPIYVAASLFYYGLWFVYLIRSKRVRTTYD